MDLFITGTPALPSPLGVLKREDLGQWSDADSQRPKISPGDGTPVTPCPLLCVTTFCCAQHYPGSADVKYVSDFTCRRVPANSRTQPRLPTWLSEPWGETPGRPHSAKFILHGLQQNNPMSSLGRQLPASLSWPLNASNMTQLVVNCGQVADIPGLSSF